MIISNSFNTLKNNGNRNFGSGQRLDKITSQAPKSSLTPLTLMKIHKAVYNFTILASILGFAGISINDCSNKQKSEEQRQILGEIVPEDTANIYARSNVLPRSKQPDFLDGVIDSLKGGKSKPNKTFRIDSLIQNDVSEYRSRADNILREASETAKYLNDAADSLVIKTKQ